MIRMIIVHTFGFLTAKVMFPFVTWDVFLVISAIMWVSFTTYDNMRERFNNE